MCVSMCILDTIGIRLDHLDVHTVHKCVTLCILDIAGNRTSIMTYVCVHMHFGHYRHSIVFMCLLDILSIRLDNLDVYWWHTFLDTIGIQLDCLGIHACVCVHFGQYQHLIQSSRFLSNTYVLMCIFMFNFTTLIL